MAELLTAETVADRLKVHPNTLSRWRSEGEGPPFVRLGKGKRAHVRYDSGKLDRFLKRAEEGGA